MCAIRIPHRSDGDAHAASHRNDDNRADRHSDCNTCAHENGNANAAHGDRHIHPKTYRNEDENDAYCFV